MDKDFGNWLAGFIDGEGCFGIYKRKDSSGWIFRFFVKLRDDDAAILHECQRRIGGTVRYEKPKNPKWGGQVIWAVSSRKDCLALIDMLDECPLRAKKQRDYQVWREAVLQFDKVQRHIGNDAAKKANAPIWEKLADLKLQMNKLREYSYDN